jgi:hypothetical protein
VDDDARPAAHPGHDVPMTAPVAADVTPHPLARWLRARVATLRSVTRRRNFPGAVELVSPAAPAGTVPLAVWTYGDEPTDHGLRVDVLTRLLTDCRCRDTAQVSLVHVRPGPHDPADLDLGWAAAGTVAGAIARVEVVTAVALSRWGWYDLRTGQQRSWARLRARQSPSR